MDESTQVHTKTIRKVVKELTNGKMVGNTWVHGKTGSNMGKEHIQTKRVLRERVCGKMVKEPNG